VGGVIDGKERHVSGGPARSHLLIKIIIPKPTLKSAEKGNRVAKTFLLELGTGIGHTRGLTLSAYMVGLGRHPPVYPAREELSTQKNLLHRFLAGKKEEKSPPEGKSFSAVPRVPRSLPAD